MVVDSVWYLEATTLLKYWRWEETDNVKVQLRSCVVTLLPPRLAIRLSAGIVGALLPSHRFPALVLCMPLANLNTPCAVVVLTC